MNTKSSVYPAVIFASLFGFLGLVLLSLKFTVSIELGGAETYSLPKKMPLTAQIQVGESLSTIPSVPTSESTQPELVKQNTQSLSNTEHKQAGRKAGQGGLRVSNQTDQPVRVALLAQHPKEKSTGKSDYGKPVHWDFAPEEGSAKGLTLSLPEGNLKLKKGDILVAFAQDGSRRYWGPYVVGETLEPAWNSQTSEWKLTFQP